MTPIENENQLSRLYTALTGTPPVRVEPLAASGSNRRYYRLEGSPTLIGVVGESVEENRTFLYLAQHFRAQGLPVPEVLAADDGQTCYLQEDLGNTSLFDLILKGRTGEEFTAEVLSLLHRTLSLLPRIQIEGARNLDFNQCYPQPAFDERSIRWDLNYFKYCFLKLTGIDFTESRLEDDFDRLTRTLLKASDQTAFMYRDFQSRNVMVRDGEPWFIDFQGGRRGPVYYDVASFLWQAKANFPDKVRQDLLATYLRSLQQYSPIEEESFYQNLRQFVLFRTLQVLGAYGFRGYYERKEHFLQSIPFATRNLNNILQEFSSDYPYLHQISQKLLDRQESPVPEQPLPSGLTVSVTSFSYKKGIPEDTSGNGGGFVFDCRAIHNPGRYDEYKSLTGMDEPVIRFLEKDGEITTFLQHVYALVDAAVARYLKRGFTHLSVCFGCTGGRHRSVYAAQHLAEHLRQAFDIRIILTHREQNIQQIWEGKK